MDVSKIPIPIYNTIVSITSIDELLELKRKYKYHPNKELIKAINNRIINLQYHQNKETP